MSNIFDWRHFLILAEHMYAKRNDFPDSEACCRTLINRAYYSAFSLIREYLKNNKGREFTTSPHEAIYRYMIYESNNRDLYIMGEKLRSLFRHRVNSDYYNTWRGKQGVVKTSGKVLKYSNQIRQKIKPGAPNPR